LSHTEGMKNFIATIVSALFYVYILTKLFIQRWYNQRYSKEKALHALLNENFTPVPERTSDKLEVVGKVPTDLDGMYVRNGPNPFVEVQEQDLYHFFDGDGMIHGVNFNPAKDVSYLNRWVNTLRLQEEKRLGKAISDYTRVGAVRTPIGFFMYCVRWIKNTTLVALHLRKPPQPGEKTANTSLEYHAGRFLALNETDLPYQIKLPSLETVGVYDFKGKFNFPPNHFTAHPKIDPDTNDMIAFSYSLETKPFCRYYVFDSSDNILRQVVINWDIPVFMHDFAITKNHSIIFNLPFQFRLDKVLDGISPFLFDPTTPSRFAVFPRMITDQSQIKWFETPACYMWHALNAWEEGDEVVLYGCRSNRVDYFKLDDENLMPEHPIPVDNEHMTYLHTWRFNLKTGEVKERTVTKNFGCEFPTINNKYIGVKTRWGYIGRYADRSIKDSYIDAVIKLDVASDKEGQEFKYQVYEFPQGWYSGEWLFVPRTNEEEEKKGKKQEELEEKFEDDGYIMSYMYDSNNKVSELWVIDAGKNFGKEECLLARIKIGYRIPYGFHGKFFTRQQIANQVFD